MEAVSTRAKNAQKWMTESKKLCLTIKWEEAKGTVPEIQESLVI